MLTKVLLREYTAAIAMDGQHDYIAMKTNSSSRRRDPTGREHLHMATLFGIDML